MISSWKQYWLYGSDDSLIFQDKHVSTFREQEPILSLKFSLITAPNVKKRSIVLLEFSLFISGFLSVKVFGTV